MRIRKTYVLRLYLDFEAADTLCGDLNALPDRKAHSFKNQTELIGLLLQSVQQSLEMTQSTGDFSDPDNSVKKEKGSELI